MFVFSYYVFHVLCRKFLKFNSILVIKELNLVIDTVLRECKYHLFLTLPQCDSGFSNLYFSDSVFSFFNLLPALGPLRPYWLVITAPSVWLFDRETHQPLVEWPFNHILRYGVDTNTLSIEIGQRMNPTCAGQSFKI